MTTPLTHHAAPTAGTAGYPTDGHHDGYGGKGGRPFFNHRDSQPGFPEYADRRRIANPSPLGMFALAATTLMWSLFNARARNIFEVNAIIGMALLVGGLCSLLAGMWEFVCGNTFAATAFTLLGGFWGSYGILYWPSSGSLSAYTESDLGSALGIYFMVWMIVAFMLFIGTFRGSVPLAATFFFLFLMYMLIGIAHFTGRNSIRRAGGVIGCIASILAFYVGAVNLHNRDTSGYQLPAIPLGKRKAAADQANPRY